jgi:hypothetical protein
MRRVPFRNDPLGHFDPASRDQGLPSRRDRSRGPCRRRPPARRARTSHSARAQNRWRGSRSRGCGRARAARNRVTPARLARPRARGAREEGLEVAQEHPVEDSAFGLATAPEARGWILPAVHAGRGPARSARGCGPMASGARRRCFGRAPRARTGLHLRTLRVSAQEAAGATEKRGAMASFDAGGMVAGYAARPVRRAGNGGARAALP